MTFDRATQKQPIAPREDFSHERPELSRQSH